MSASLSITNEEIVRAVLQVMGSGRTAVNMDSATEADLRQIIRDGLRRFYFPMVGEYPYQWRWLEKHHAISVDAKYTTGTITVSGGTITLAGGTWPTWLTDGFIRVSGHVLFVTVRTSDTLATASNTALSVAGGTTYELYRYRYSLPSDFSEWLGGVTYADGTTSRPLVGSDESEIRLRYAIGQGQGVKTTHFAISSANPTNTIRIVFWPVPLPDAFITGVYLSTPQDNLPDDLKTPGSTLQVGPMYAVAALEAILSAAEVYSTDAAGIHEQKFQAALASAIAHDKTVGGVYDFSHIVSDSRTFGGVLPTDFSDALI